MLKLKKVINDNDWVDETSWLAEWTILYNRSDWWTYEVMSGSLTKWLDEINELLNRQEQLGKWNEQVIDWLDK